MFEKNPKKENSLRKIRRLLPSKKSTKQLSHNYSKYICAVYLQ